MRVCIPNFVHSTSRTVVLIALLASVLAANAVLRSLFGVAFPLFTSYMYNSLGIHWASSIPAFLALACVPFPFIFYRYGPAIRKRCKFAAEADAFMKSLREEAEHEDDDDEDEAASTTDDADSGDKPTEPKTGHHHHRTEQEQEREAQLEAEAFDYSYGREEQQPEYAAIKTSIASTGGQSKSVAAKKSGRSLRPSRSLTYEGSPYDIDRVNTNESFAKRAANSRPGSIRK